MLVIGRKSRRYDCAIGGSLVRLEQLHLDATRLPNPLVLRRLPGRYSVHPSQLVLTRFNFRSSSVSEAARQYRRKGTKKYYSPYQNQLGTFLASTKKSTRKVPGQVPEKYQGEYQKSTKGGYQEYQTTRYKNFLVLFGTFPLSSCIYIPQKKVPLLVELSIVRVDTSRRWPANHDTDSWRTPPAHCPWNRWSRTDCSVRWRGFTADAAMAKIDQTKLDLHRWTLDMDNQSGSLVLMQPRRRQKSQKVCLVLSPSSPTFYLKTPSFANNLWGQLPPELLRAIVEASSSPLRTYIQLLSLSHTIRSMIRGLLRQMSFQRSEIDALVALVGSCKGLVKLTFPDAAEQLNFPPPAQRHRDHKTTTPGSWVDEAVVTLKGRGKQPYSHNKAFWGHTQLAVLENFPTSSEPDIERILSYLPGLVELTVSWRFPMSTRLLAALARFCPDLQVLRWEPPSYGIRELPISDLGALAPLSGVLKHLDLGHVKVSKETLAAFVGSLSAVTSLKLHSCPPAALEPIASHLTSLELSMCQDLPGPWLCRLERLSLNLSWSGPILAPLTLLLAANQATLRSLSLTTHETAESLIAPLSALPCLTHLDLEMSHAGRILSALPPHLVDRLESLRLCLYHATPGTTPVRIASSHLQSFSLDFRGRMMESPAPGLVLECPALVALCSDAPLLSLCCPRLRTLRSPPMEEPAPTPMPDLEFAGPSILGHLVDPAWLLAGSSPRLRVLTGIPVPEPDPAPHPLVLRLPGKLEYLDLHIKMPGARTAEGDPPLPPFDIQVEAPGLLDFNLDLDVSCPPDEDGLDEDVPSVRVRLCRHSPYLDSLRLCSYDALLSFQIDEEAGTTTMQLRDSVFACGNIEAASLIRLLTRHGARLSEIQVKAKKRSMASEDWAQLMTAISPCPQLRALSFENQLYKLKLVLDCPHLVDLFNTYRLGYPPPEEREHAVYLPEDELALS
ncbi:hypothetical protein PAPYR_540 [Paratrimastix pyriformis]|uniref:F-box domain-containing protein n=1 Tax=Paratrimastix pyriformis TaxID=342808 RepID=A0ABQ8UTW5_9EUKA|nr:hypothetical protein PAPYR_540 [Paratrimastix pyriformis]